jgi:hypothetical protein
MKFKILLVLSILSIWLIVPLETKADIIIPETEVNLRNMQITYQTNISNEVLYYSTILNINFNGKQQQLFRIDISVGDYIGSVFGGAKIYYYDTVGGSVQKTVKYTLNEWIELDTTYPYWRLQLVTVITPGESLQSTRTNFEQSVLPLSEAFTISEGLVISTSTFVQLYQQGYDAGELNGFEGAQSIYGILVNGTYQTAQQYSITSFNDGYAEGLTQGSTNALAIRNMIPGILGVTFAFFFQLASISFLGISALDLIGAVITIATSIFIIRIFLNR